MTRSVLLLFWEGYVGIAPTVVTLAQALNEAGYEVTILGTENSYPPAGNLGENVNIIYFKTGTEKLLPIFNKLSSPIATLNYTLNCVGYILKCLLKKRNFDLTIAVDIFGLLAAFTNYYLVGQKFLFLSLELPAPQPLRQKIGTVAYQKAEAVIVQDEDRLANLSEYFNYQHPKVFYLPNSPLPTTVPSENSKTDNFFRERFQLSFQQYPCLLVHAGMIRDEVLSKTLAETFAQINSGCALILHSSKVKGENQYIRSLRTVNSKNLFLSLEPVAYEEIGKIYTAATIGLAFYTDTYNDNFSKIALASGKLAAYLMYGKPVLVNALPSLQRLVNDYECGVVVENPSDPREMEAAIHRIMSDYDRYSKNAEYCFKAEFDPRPKLKSILEFMESL